MNEQIRELGKRLVQELQLHDGVDTLGRWMAHYVAEVMHTAETTTGPQATQAKEACFQTILKLWEHLHQASGFPISLRSYERAVETLNLLHPPRSEHDQARHLQERDNATKPATKKEQRVNLLQDFILDLDWGTRLIIENLVGELSKSTTPPGIDDTVLSMLPACPKTDAFRTLYLMGSRKMYYEVDVPKSEQIELRIRVLKRLATLATTLEKSLAAEMKDTVNPPSPATHPRGPERTRRRNQQHR